MASLAKKLTGWLEPSDNEDRGLDAQDICVGATFARVTKTQLTETAKVLDIVEDEGGIAHVRYESRLHRASRTIDQGQRTLALVSFLDRFEKLRSRTF